MIPQDHSTLTKYLNEVGKKKRLTFEEEKTATPAQLIDCNLLLPVFAARRWSKTPEELLDRIQDGNVGLIKAAERFDPSFGVHFSTFALHHIVNEIRHSARVMGRVVATSHRSYRLYKQACQLRDSGLPYEAIATQLGMNREEVGHLFKYSEESSDLDPLLVDGSVDIRTDLISVVSKTERVLTSQEQLILNQWLQGYSLEEIGKLIGVSREQVRRSRETALRKLRGSYYERD